MELGQSALEGLVTAQASFWENRSVLLTGHTGFKGGWLAVCLKHLRARVHGYALDPETTPNLFGDARVAAALASDTRADLADLAALRRVCRAGEPEVVFHLAAQPLVRTSYRLPVATLQTNVIGTAHVLEAARETPSVRAIVVITTDKVYENRRWEYAYRETDVLGGHDVYSASKAAVEIVTASYRASFFAGAAQPVHVATARAGNVIGGGDWAEDRLLPDCMRAFAEGTPVQLRNPRSVRPWQHVLEPLSGYLELAERLLGADGSRFASAWNFGPDSASHATVSEVARAAAKLWGNGAIATDAPAAESFHETEQLRIDSSRARAELHWKPRWPIHEALRQTVLWHRARIAGKDMREVTEQQIASYEQDVGRG